MLSGTLVIWCSFSSLPRTEFMSCAWKWVKTNYAARRFLAKLCSWLTATGPAVGFGSSAGDGDGDGEGVFAERLWCERCQKDFHQRQQFRGINHGRQVRGWVPWSSTQNCHKVEQSSESKECSIAISAGCDRHLNGTQKGLWRAYYGQPNI